MQLCTIILLMGAIFILQTLNPQNQNQSRLVKFQDLKRFTTLDILRYIVMSLKMAMLLLHQNYRCNPGPGETSVLNIVFFVFPLSVSINARMCPS